jgi:hypothetical protein
MRVARGTLQSGTAQYREYFATEVPAERAALIAHSQVLIAHATFGAIITTAAWRGKPSCMRRLPL